MTVTRRILADLDQGTPEWFEQRCGIVTASVVGRLLTVGAPGALDYACPDCDSAASSPCVSRARKIAAPIKSMHDGRVAVAVERKKDALPVIEVADNQTSEELTALLVAERITGWSEPSFVSDDMMRGIEDEPRARDLYSERYAPVVECGFMKLEGDGWKLGYSPDGLVGDDGLIEVKSRRPRKQLQTILSGQVPVENMAQLQAGLLVSGRSWIDYVSYCGGMPMWVRRVEPDERWQKAITDAVTTFEENAALMVDNYRRAVDGLPETERVTELDIVI
jgi:hypothetical protein